MIFIFGAAYQGMEDYACEHCGVQEIRTAGENGELDFTSGAVNGLERFVLDCVRRGNDPREQFEQMRDRWQHAVLIGLDFSCGLVPMDAETRAWREANGRFNTYLAAESERTVRMFCGLPQVLK